MISRYKEMDVDDAVAGMVLSCAVLDHHGGVLLPKGTALSDALLASLSRRGIERVQVRDDTVSEQALAAERERVGQRLLQLFRHSGAGSAAGMLRQQLAAHRLESLL
jgi:hypothetical protein